jgi:glycosyltransferase involved in cell wall biosynthesis
MIKATLKSRTADGAAVDYSVVIPAYNEEVYLPSTMAALQDAMETVPYRGEIIVVDNGSTDSTAAVAKRLGAVVVFEPFRQISRARNTGARTARGRFLVFLDGDTILPPPLLQKALDLLAGGSCCGGGSLLEFDRPLSLLAARLVRLWNWLSKKNRLAAGSFLFCLAVAFEATGGFDERTYAGEEIFLSRRLHAWGKKRRLHFTIVHDYPVLTSSRKFYWYSSLQLGLLLLLFTVFPFALRSRFLCSFWYSRPAE